MGTRACLRPALPHTCVDWLPTHVWTRPTHVWTCFLGYRRSSAMMPMGSHVPPHVAPSCMSALTHHHFRVLRLHAQLVLAPEVDVLHMILRVGNSQEYSASRCIC